MALFDAFSKFKFAEKLIAKGAVICCHVKETNPPKEKMFVILGESNDGICLGVVFINSLVNFNVVNSQELIDLQYPVRMRSYLTFLKYDSFIDCTEIIEMSLQNIKDTLLTNPGIILGEINEDDLKEICKLVCNSPVITPYMLKRFNLV